MQNKINVLRICAVTALAVLSVLSLLSCGKGSEPTSTDLLYGCLEKTGKHAAGSIYFSEAEREGKAFLSAEAMKKVYGGLSPEGLYESFAVYLGCDDIVYEIHIYKAISRIKAEELEKIMNKRITLLQSREVYMYDIENYETVTARARVVRQGVYVALLVTDKNDAAEKWFTTAV